MKNITKVLIILLLIAAIVTVLPEFKVLNSSSNTYRYVKSLEKKALYYNCINGPYESDATKEEFTKLFKSLGNDVSIYFKDINNDFSETHNANKTYYSASAVKIFDIIYLVEQAREGKMDLNKTITYKASYQKSGSANTSKHKINDEIPITELMGNILEVSDNAAHFMLVHYIGANTLNKYFKEKYDINLKISNEKPFEYYYTAKMANRSVELMYDILKVDDEYSNLIKKNMNNNNDNGLNFSDKTFFHKYGMFGMYYHDIGILNQDNPYLISILTNYGEGNYTNKVSKISEQIYDIYEKNNQEKIAYCTNFTG